MTRLRLPDGAMQEVGQISSHNTASVFSSDWRKALQYVNSVELDVWPLSGWRVSHDYNANAGKLTNYLQELRTWRRDNPDAGLIVVFIEIKSREGWGTVDFENAITENCFTAAELFKPADLIARCGAQPSASLRLRDLVREHGWPKFSAAELKSKVMFVVNGGGHVTETYLRERPITGPDATPLAFMMTPADYDGPGSENVLILNEEYDTWASVDDSPKNCLRRAYLVKQGNEDMVEGNSDIAKKLMQEHRINFLCYDDVRNAFAHKFA